MDKNLSPGLTREATYTVTADMSPPHLPGILATSRMISLVEDTCLAAVDPLLGEGQVSVGTRVDMTHVGSARVGEGIHVRIGLVKVTAGRLLSFETEVTAPCGVLSTGTHQRLVVARSRIVPPVISPGPET